MSLDFTSTVLHRAVRFGFVPAVTLSLVAACATTPATTSAPSDAAASTEPAFAQSIPVVRSGRYTLVEVAPERAQRDPMEQIVDISIPATLTATVGEALRYVLLRTGYRLCEGDEETRALDALPLPAAHLELGPLTLREALKVLIGSARELEIDEAARQVCVRLMGSAGSTPPAIIIPMPDLPLLDIPSP